MYSDHIMRIESTRTFLSYFDWDGNLVGETDPIQIRLPIEWNVRWWNLSRVSEQKKIVSVWNSDFLDGAILFWYQRNTLSWKYSPFFSDVIKIPTRIPGLPLFLSISPLMFTTKYGYDTFFLHLLVFEMSKLFLGFAVWRISWTKTTEYQTTVSLSPVTKNHHSVSLSDNETEANKTSDHKAQNNFHLRNSSVMFTTSCYSWKNALDFVLKFTKWN